MLPKALSCSLHTTLAKYISHAALKRSSHPKTNFFSSWRRTIATLSKEDPTVGSWEEQVKLSQALAAEYDNIKARALDHEGDPIFEYQIESGVFHHQGR